MRLLTLIFIASIASAQLVPVVQSTDSGAVLIYRQLATTDIPTLGTVFADKNDPRLSDARTPTAHTHAESEITGLVTDLAGKASTAIDNNGSYRTLMQASASHTAAKVAGTYALSSGGVAAVGGTGTLYPIQTVYIASADYPTINGVATKLRIRAQVYTNDVAPFTGTITVGLFPITRPATSGGAGLDIYTIGTVVAGSNGAVFTNPPADGLLSAVGSDFSLPANGHYILAFVTSATMATSSHLHITAQLQYHN